MPSFIPEPHAAYARQIGEMIAREDISLRDQISKEVGLSTAYTTRLVEEPSIVCVAGERGSGKTTVLATAAAELAGAGHVVVPPVRPEYFPPSGSLIPMAVAHLKTTVRTDWLDEESGVDPDTSLKLFTAVDRTLRQANLFSYGNSDSSSLRADEQAADRSLAASADSDFLGNWQRLTAEVRQVAAKRSKSSKKPLIVLPVDDPDLTPGTLSDIMLDLRLLTSVDGVVGITCLDLAEVRSVLSDAYAGSYHSAPDRQLAERVVQAQIAKAFPDDRRVVIEGLNSEQKLAFRALDLPLPSVEELCKAHTMPKPFEDDTLGSVLRMHDGSPSLYTNALPANPRDLRALAYRLSCTEPDSPAGGNWAALELCRSAIDNGLKQSGANDPSLWPSGLPFVVHPTIDGMPSCALRFEDIAIAPIKAAEHSLPGGNEEDSTTVAVARYSGVDGRIMKRGERAQTIQRLDPSFTYAVLLVREFSHHYRALQCGISGPAPFVGGDRRSSYMKVSIDGTETDHTFLIPPAWEAFYDNFVLDHALSALMAVACHQHAFSDRRLEVEAYFLDFCHNIVSIQLSRKPAKDPARASSAIRERDETKAQQFLNRDLTKLFKEIESCFEADDRREREDDVRVVDFRRWVETGIVNICHDKLLRPEFIEKLLKLRQELLNRRRRASIANDAAASLLERRVKACLDETWVSPLIAVIWGFSEKRGAILHKTHTAAIESVERGQQRLLGGSALSESDDDGAVSQTQDQANDFEIAMSVLDQLESEADAPAKQSAI